jgi:predicted unusual protein kinase regulating ubiquinone biosynthesis (AarF/ABC1/UbiB family)
MARWGAGVAAIAAVAAAVALLVGRPRRSGPSPHAGHGRLTRTTRWGRNLAIAKMGGVTAANFASHRARRVFAAAERREALDREFELATAEQVVATLGNLKGALMKIGQLASYLDQGLPEHLRTALSQLQSDAPPMTSDLVDAAVFAELGRPPHEIFATWDPEPIAAASIGQVHRAITSDGRAVAVKVQYPGVDDAIRSDLANADMIFAGVAQLFPGLDPGPVVAELRQRLIEELDYRLEAQHQQQFAQEYAGHPTIHVPAVVEELSSARVLTTELVEGVSFAEMLTWSRHERNLAAETIYRFAFGSLYGLGMFNGDPHPGNYLFRPGGQVSFLDFGLVKRFSSDELTGFGDLIDAVVLQPDTAQLRTVIERLGLLDPVAEVSDQQVFDYFSHFYEFVRVDGEYTISDEYASATVRQMFDVSGPHGPVMKAANVPPSFVVIQRINLGLYAIFGQIGATANWRRIAEELWPFVGGPPSTPMGESVRAWEIDRARRPATG